MSQGKACRSVPSERQPRSSTSESDTTHGRPTPGPAGEKQLEFGGAALMTSAAAQRRVCLPLGFFAARVARMIAIVFLFAIASFAAPSENPRAEASSTAGPYLFSASFDPTGKEVIVDRSAADPQAAAQQQ